MNDLLPPSAAVARSRRVIRPSAQQLVVVTEATFAYKLLSILSQEFEGLWPAKNGGDSGGGLICISLAHRFNELASGVFFHGDDALATCKRTAFQLGSKYWDNPRKLHRFLTRWRVALTPGALDEFVTEALSADPPGG